MICGENTTIEAAHIRFPRLEVGKRPVGTGEKPDDIWTVPLCGMHHREQHQRGELQFWEAHNRDPLLVSLALWAHTGNHEVGEQIARWGWDEGMTVHGIGYEEINQTNKD
jgi:hypothetical protein